MCAEQQLAAHQAHHRALVNLDLTLTQAIPDAPPEPTWPPLPTDGERASEWLDAPLTDDAIEWRAYFTSNTRINLSEIRSYIAWLGTLSPEIMEYFPTDGLVCVLPWMESRRPHGGADRQGHYVDQYIHPVFSIFLDEYVFPEILECLCDSLGELLGTEIWRGLRKKMQWGTVLSQDRAPRQGDGSWAATGPEVAKIMEDYPEEHFYDEPTDEIEDSPPSVATLTYENTFDRHTVPSLNNPTEWRAYFGSGVRVYLSEFQLFAHWLNAQDLRVIPFIPPGGILCVLPWIDTFRVDNDHEDPRGGIVGGYGHPCMNIINGIISPALMELLETLVGGAQAHRIGVCGPGLRFQWGTMQDRDRFPRLGDGSWAYKIFNDEESLDEYENLLMQKEPQISFRMLKLSGVRLPPPAAASTEFPFGSIAAGADAHGERNDNSGMDDDYHEWANFFGIGMRVYSSDISCWAKWLGTRDPRIIAKFPSDGLICILPYKEPGYPNGDHNHYGRFVEVRELCATERGREIHYGVLRQLFVGLGQTKTDELSNGMIYQWGTDAQYDIAYPNEDGNELLNGKAGITALGYTVVQRHFKLL